MIKYKKMGKWYVNHVDSDPYVDVPPVLALLYINAAIDRLLRQVPVRY